MSTPSEYKPPTPEEIADFCAALREKMTEAAERSTLTWEATFGDSPEDSYDDGAFSVRITGGPTRRKR